MTASNDFSYYIAEAKRCRRIAQGADQRTADALIELAEEYEAKADSLRRPDAQP
ncbi:MAG: hypothetical protein J7493_00080 [Porphyrobacter sp.]|nr:hypothetical protein [Porphyrobacter sp.]